jgi:hypothetical protein
MIVCVAVVGHQVRKPTWHLSFPPPCWIPAIRSRDFAVAGAGLD